MNPRPALESIPDGASIVIGPACATPTTALAALAEMCAGRNWTLMSGLLFDHEPIIAAVDHGLRYRTWHATRSVADLIDAGSVDYVPLRASQIPAFLRRTPPTVAVVRVSPPDRHGYCSLGPSASYPWAAVEHSRIVIAEVDERLPRTHGQTLIHRSRIDTMLESATPTPRYDCAKPDDVSARIATHLLRLIPDRPVLQLGIGTVPEAFLHELLERRIGGLRFVGMGADVMVGLAERGLLADDDPRIPPIAAPDLLGSETLMDFAHDNPLIGVYPSTWAQSPRDLGAMGRLVSINSAVEIDLAGQVNNERVAGRQVSGTGGSIDFLEAATISEGGVRVIALPSTTRDGRRSRIVPRLGDGLVSFTRAQVDVIVTEHGVAHLEGLAVRERTEALIAIADPRFREELASALTRS